MLKWLRRVPAKTYEPVDTACVMSVCTSPGTHQVHDHRVCSEHLARVQHWFGA